MAGYGLNGRTCAAEKTLAVYSRCETSPLNFRLLDPMSKPKSRRSIYIVLAVSSVFHFVGLSILGGVIIWENAQSPAPELEAPPVVEPPTPPQRFALSLNNEMVRPTKSRIAVQDIRMTDLDSLDLSLPQTSNRVGFGGFGGGGLGIVSEMPKLSLESLFGNSQSAGVDLAGAFFDLKQTPARQAKEVDYAGFVRRYTSGSWAMSQLERFYQAERKLYATTLLIPHRMADQAPAAFGVAGEVQPSQWLAHYEGKITPPFNGKFRFWGFADDVLIVRVNGRVVLDGSFHEGEYTDWRSREPDLNRKFNIGNGALAVGDWINVQKGRELKIEILIGERPGGHFSTYLLIQEKGQEYPQGPDGRPVLPIFKMTPLPPGFEQQLLAEMGNEQGLMSLDGPCFARFQ
ncbi:hypothetical protein [Cerasicoccus maritimus]|uniref:hypothetical protein n=1 Tax=Cerasicoccus maritimus TaxID=490089 RepID=UPI00285254D7|nr:hypothetical protein [Cerasicoccus maritimus]